ncbi:hypothetical protein SBRCBS47491_005017 [Sporothrix bragantina]|uniref:O-methyltransferase C-terminal domain-containing protein n=1 Tax=Sporothrix bragantina TaxID=671064 RepID=A0ABP0BTF7_9PEZI
MAVHQRLILKRGLMFRRQVGVSSSNPFSTGPSGFPGSGNGGVGSGDGTGTGTSTGSDGSGSGSSGTDTGSTRTGNSDGSGDSGSGSGGSGDVTATTSTPFGSTFGAGSGSENGSYGHSTTGLSNSAIAGIAIGSVLAFFIVVGFLVWFCTRKRRPQQQGPLADDGHSGRHGEETVAFAKVANALPAQTGYDNGHQIHNEQDLPNLPDDPPAYEEIGQQGNFNQGNHPPQRAHAIHDDYVLGSVPDGPSPAGVADKLDSLVATLAEASKNLRAGLPNSLLTNATQKADVVTALKAGIEAIQSPQDAFLDIMVTMSRLVAQRIFVKWKLFDAIPATGSITYSDLAAKADADTEIVTRFAWVLIADGVLEQVGPDSVAHTPKSMMLNTPAMTAMTVFGFDAFLQVFVYMPQYFDDHGRNNPTDRLNTVVACARGHPNEPVWAMFKSDPELMDHFTFVMTAFEATYPHLGSYKLDWLVEAVANDKDTDPDRVAFVDVGGSKGHTIKQIAAQVPGFPLDHRCVLEDRSEVLALVDAEDDAQLRTVRRVVTDFHTEQPVKNARVYYIRRCLHDYSDDEGVIILKHLAAAMAPDSKLLIVDHVMNDPPSAYAASSDLFMACLGGKERTLRNFEDITAQAELKITGVYRNEGTDAAVVECVKAWVGEH